MFSYPRKMLLASLGLLLFVEMSLVQAQYYPVDNSLINVNAISFDTNNPYQCLCDLTSGSCDDRCCCDTDCSSAATTSWRNSGICQVSTQAKSFCSLEDNVFQIVNVGDRRNIQYSFFSNSTDDGVCVEVTPDPTEFEYTTMIDSSQLSTTKIDELITNMRNSVAAPTNPTFSATRYRFGLNLLLPSDAGYLTISTPDAFSNCDFTHRLRFGMNEDSRTCRYPVTQTSCTADTRLSSVTSAATVYIPNYGNKTANATVSIRELWLVNSTTGVRTQNATISPVAPTLDASATPTCTCSNVVVGVEQIIRTSTTRITDINYILTLSDVTFPCATGGFIYKTSAVSYLSSSASLTLADRTSTTPGYQAGNPIRIGSRVDNYVNVSDLEYNVNGIDISGNCLDQGSVASSVSGKTVLFGASAVYTCGLSITDISTFCESSATSGNWPNLGLFSNFRSGTTYIGSFANSNPHYLRDYIALSGTTRASAGPSYNSASQVCTMYTGTTINIFYSSVGYYEGYQNYIAEATVSFDGQTQFFRSADPQTVNFQLSINFVNIDKITNQFTSGERPSFIPQLPDDILYPFFFPTEEGAASLTVSWALILMGLLVAVGIL